MIPHIPCGVVAQDVGCKEYRVTRPRAPKRFTCPVGGFYINVISSKGRGRTGGNLNKAKRGGELRALCNLIGT